MDTMTVSVSFGRLTQSHRYQLLQRICMQPMRMPTIATSMLAISEVEMDGTTETMRMRMANCNPRRQLHQLQLLFCSQQMLL